MPTCSTCSVECSIPKRSRSRLASSCRCFWASQSGPTSTWAEQPVVVDVDNDGHADIVVSSDTFQVNKQTALHVLHDVANKWTRTRRIWNQHAYHITNANEDGSIPRVETPNWLVPGFNNFRTNAFIPGETPDQADRFTYKATDGVA